MNRLIGKWLDGIGYLIFDDLISFYTFFTVAFAECAYLWNYKPSSIALPFTIILLCYVLNVIICAYLKGRYEGTRTELIISRIYLVVIAALLFASCRIDATASIVLNTLLFGITMIWMVIRIYQNTDFSNDSDERVQIISKLFKNKVFWMNSQIVVVLAPFIALAVYVNMISNISIILKVIGLILYFICIPFIAVFEDESAVCNIFELAYRITWKKDAGKDC